jgi:hypothetical protein
MAKLVLNSDGPAYTMQKAEHYAQHAATLIDQLNLDTAEQKSLAAGLPLGLLVRSK